MSFLKYQREWVQDKSQVRVWEKSRRIGASWVMAAEAVLEAAATSGQNCLYIGYNEKMTRGFIDDCAEFARGINQAAAEIEEVALEDEDKDILAFRIRFASGHQIMALSSRPANLRGTQGHVIVDEAAFHDDLAGLLKAAIALLMWGGRVSVISTHNGVENPFNKLCEDIRSGEKDYSLHRVTIDDALGDGLYERICERLGLEYSKEGEVKWRKDLFSLYGDDAKEELQCIPLRSGGSYLGRGLVEMRMKTVPILRLSYPDEFAGYPEKRRKGDTQGWIDAKLAPIMKRLPMGLVCHLGQDYGRVSDLSVISPLLTLQDLSRETPFLIEMSKVPFEQQKQILWWVIDHIPKFGGAAIDATGSGQTIAEVTWQRYGQKRIEMVMLSEKWYSENLPPFRRDFQNDTISVPKDADVLSDLASFQTINGIPKLPKIRTKDQKGKTRHADSAIAILLAHYAALAISESIGYKAARQEDYSHKRSVRTTNNIRGRKGLL